MSLQAEAPIDITVPHALVQAVEVAGVVTRSDNTFLVDATKLASVVPDQATQLSVLAAVARANEVYSAAPDVPTVAAAAPDPTKIISARQSQPSTRSLRMRAPIRASLPCLRAARTCAKSESARDTTVERDRGRPPCRGGRAAKSP